MARLWSFELGTFQEVPEEQVQAALLTETHALPEGQQLPVRFKDGTVGAVPIEQFAQSGATYIPKPERDALEQQERYGKQDVETFLQEAAGTVTMSVSDRIGEALGYGEDFQARREANPVAALAGQVAGAIVPVGAGAIIGRAGKAAEGLVRAVPGAAKLGTTATKVATAAARGAVESAAFEGVQSARDQAIEDVDLTTEYLIGRLGPAALLGGAVGAGLTAGLSFAGSGVAKLKANRMQMKDVDSMVDAYTAQTGVKPTKEVQGAFKRFVNDVYEMAADKYAGASAVVSGKSKEVIKKALTDENFQKLFVKGDGVLDDFARTFQPKLQQYFDDTDKVGEVLKASIKRDHINKLIQPSDDAIEATRGVASKVLRDAETLAAKHQSIVVDDFLTAARKAAAKIDEAGDDAARAYFELDNLKKAMLDMRVQVAQALDNPGREIANRLDDSYSATMNHLKSKRHFGKLGEFQGKANAAFEKRQSIFRQVSRDLTGVEEQHLVTGAVREVQTGKVRSFAQSLQNARGDDKFRRLKNLTEADDEFFAVVDEFLDLSPQQRSALERARTSTKDMFQSLDSNIDDVAQVAQARDLLQRGFGLDASQLGAMFGAGAVASTVGVRPAAGMAGLIGALANPGKMMTTVIRVREMAQATRTAMKGSGKGFISGSAKTSRRITDRTSDATTGGSSVSRAARLSVLASANYGEKAIDAAKSKAEQYKDNTKGIQALLQDPKKLTDHLAAALKPISQDVPEVAMSGMQVLGRAVQFLNSKASYSPNAKYGMPAAYDSFQPTDAEVAQFERYLRTIENPLTILDDLEKNVITPEAVEALKAVYPRMYQDLVAEVLTQIHSHGDKIPHQKRVQLGILFDATTDPTLEPSYILATQPQQQAPQPQAAPTRKQANLTGLREMQKGQTLSTYSQQLEARRN